VDGAVVLTDQLRIIGFGAEVRVSTGTDTIHVAEDAEGEKLSLARMALAQFVTFDRHST
jgi:hypothetical protein